MKFLALFLLFLGFSGSALAERCHRIPPGVIVDFNEPSHEYRLVRSKREEPIRFFMPLISGDRLSFSHTGYLSVQTADGTATWSSQYSPICVAEGEPVTWAERISQHITERLTRSRDRGYVPTVTRGEGSLRVAFGDAGSGYAVIGSGTRNLAFSWLQGISPFEVRLIDKAGALVVDESQVLSRTLILESPRVIPEGDYILEIRDSSGDDPIVVSLKAISPNGPVTDASSAMALAGELAASGRELDAFFVLSPYRFESKSASDFMDVLAGR